MQAASCQLDIACCLELETARSTAQSIIIVQIVSVVKACREAPGIPMRVLRLTRGIML
jgi:hypothetical protein